MELASQNLSKNLINYFTVILAFLVPILNLPFTTEISELNRLLLIGFFVAIAGLLWVLPSLRTGRIDFRYNSFDIPLLLLVIVGIITTLTSDHRLTSIVGPYGRFYPSLASLLVFFLFYLIVSRNFEAKNLNLIALALILSAFLSSLLFIPQYFGKNLLGQDWTSGRSFTLAGSPLNQIILSFIGIMLAIRGILVSDKLHYKLVYAIFTVPMISALILIVLPMDLLKQGGIMMDVLPDYQTSWFVTLSSLALQPLTGSGLGTFAYDFTRFKPLSFVLNSPYWATNFLKPHSEYLTIAAEMGILGIVGWLILLARFIKHASLHLLDITTLAGGAVLLGFVLVPANISLVFLFVLALALASAVNPHLPIANRNLIFAGFITSVITLSLIIFFGTRLFLAEHAFAKAVRSQILNEETIDLMADSINLFPWFDAYYRTRAVYALSYAQRLSNSQNLTEEGKKKLNDSIAISASAASKAIELYPLNSENWRTRAGIYATLMGSVANAHLQALNDYQTAINLDPNNPILKTDYGFLLYQLGNYDQAKEQFETVTKKLKPNYPNAHFGLAKTLKELKQYNQALEEVNLTLSLITSSTPGYDQVLALQSELEKLTKK